VHFLLIARHGPLYFRFSQNCCRKNDLIDQFWITKFYQWINIQVSNRLRLLLRRGIECAKWIRHFIPIKSFYSRTHHQILIKLESVGTLKFLTAEMISKRRFLCFDTVGILQKCFLFFHSSIMNES
jgi:hypothetical protein